jgi:hypothetical protein
VTLWEGWTFWSEVSASTPVPRWALWLSWKLPQPGHELLWISLCRWPVEKYWGWDKVIIKQKLERSMCCWRAFGWSQHTGNVRELLFSLFWFLKECLVGKGQDGRCVDLVLNNKSHSRDAWASYRMSLMQFHHLLIFPVKEKSSLRLQAFIRQW